MRHFVRFSLITLLLACAAATASDPLDAALDPQRAQIENKVAWYDALQVGLEGQAWKDLAAPYDRFPARMEGVVRGPVWSLSQRSAGMAVRFVTDSRGISVRWKLLRKDREMNHMPATGVSGVDLYARDGNTWRWVAIGIPEMEENVARLVLQAPEGAHEYLLYLPLYNGVRALSIGVDEGATLAKAPPRTRKPVLFYGSSITQGGCAARPGMAYAAILGRALDMETINLGFSGNAHMDEELIELFAEVDASVYVLNPLPNMDVEMVNTRYVNFVQRLRELRPDTPIVLVGNIIPQSLWFSSASGEKVAGRSSAADQAWNALRQAQVPGLYFVPGEQLLGKDGEDTVDGVHPTDVGFMRISDAIEPVLREALK